MRRARFHPVATLAGMILSGQSEDRRGKGASAHAQRGEKRSSDKARKSYSVTLRKAEGLSDGSSNQTVAENPGQSSLGVWSFAPAGRSIPPQSASGQPSLPASDSAQAQAHTRFAADRAGRGTSQGEKKSPKKARKSGKWELTGTPLFGKLCDVRFCADVRHSPGGFCENRHGSIINFWRNRHEILYG